MAKDVKLCNNVLYFLSGLLYFGVPCAKSQLLGQDILPIESHSFCHTLYPHFPLLSSKVSQLFSLLQAGKLGSIPLAGLSALNGLGGFNTGGLSHAGTTLLLLLMEAGSCYRRCRGQYNSFWQRRFEKVTKDTFLTFMTNHR